MKTYCRVHKNQNAVINHVGWRGGWAGEEGGLDRRVGQKNLQFSLFNLWSLQRNRAQGTEQRC